MRTVGARFLALSFTLCALLFLYGPVPLLAAQFPLDTNAHFGKAGECLEHMDNPTPIAQTLLFTLCKRNSGATQWRFDIKMYAFPYSVVCSIGWIAVPENGKGTFDYPTTCPNIPSGQFKGFVQWIVGQSATMNGPADSKFVKP